MIVNYVYKTSPSFRDGYRDLTVEQKRLAKAAFKIFKENPFHPSLKPHKIHRLSAIYGKKIMSVCIAGDLRAVFYIEGNVVRSVAIGSHDIYKSG
jgi:hypothetical protein